MTSAVQPAGRPMSLAESEYLAGRAVDKDAMADSIARRVLDATSDEEAFGEIEASIQEGLPSLEEMLYQPLIFIDVEYAPSSIGNKTGAFGIYKVAHAKPAPGFKSKTLCDWVQDGEPFVASCGANNVMAGIEGAKRRGSLPIALCVVMAEQETAAGYRPFWLRLLDSKHELPKCPTWAQRTRQSVPVGEAPGDNDPL